MGAAGKGSKFWLGQWKHPRYRTAGTIHILIFAGFILLAMRAFTVLIVGVSPEFCHARPLREGRSISTTQSRITPRPLFFSAW